MILEIPTLAEGLKIYFSLDFLFFRKFPLAFSKFPLYWRKFSVYKGKFENAKEIFEKNQKSREKYILKPSASVGISNIIYTVVIKRLRTEFYDYRIC